MNPIAKEIASYLGSASMTDEEFIEHFGTPQPYNNSPTGSGRYRKGTGDNPYQHKEYRDFLDRVEALKREGWTETAENIKKEFGLTTSEYRIEKSICKDERRSADVARAKSLYANGHGYSDIGRRMGIRESSVRSLLNNESESRMLKAKETAAFLKKQVDEKKMIDVGEQVDRELGVSREKLNAALYLLKREGYNVYGGGIPQPTNPNQQTNQKVLCAPGVNHNEIFNYDKVKTIKDYTSKDGGNTFEKKFTYPSSMDSRRLKIRYGDEVGSDGFKGSEKDGIVELRRGVPDLSLGNDRYSQVRILVDGTHYIKGMAVYSDNMPDGIDVIFNTNKKTGTPMISSNKNDAQVLKPIKKDPENPFGSAIKDADQGGQYWYDSKTGKIWDANNHVGEKKLGLINKRAAEGDWSEWKDCLPSQFLAKQSKQMVEKQLALAKATKEDEFDTYNSLTNPTIKKYYLNKFASSCDAAAVDLKAAALPKQKYHVIIPNNTLRDDEIYAPGYESGTKLALVRYPHGGLFEIPICTVNNKNKLGKELIGTTPIDAVCINSRVAEQLSGADFDGDTVMCIPTHDRKGKVKIANQKPLDDLVGFDAKFKYGPDSNKVYFDSKGHEYRFHGDRKYKVMGENLKQKEMGVVSNLITDMTLGGADDIELAAAVRHSMVVIDAPKHKLDFTQSYNDNNIGALKRKYQLKRDKDGNIIGSGGAATIISRSKGEHRVDKRRGEPLVNIKGKEWYDPNRPEGALIYKTAYDKDLYYVEGRYDKKSGIKTVYTLDGKTITYNVKNDSDRKKYEVAKKYNPETKKVEPYVTRDPKTGKVYYTNSDGTIRYKTAKRTTTSTNMAETDDAMSLVSHNRHQTELIYADYANSMKALANKARIEIINTGNLKYNPNAKKIYAKEVSSLESKLNNALLNKVRERQATRLAASKIKERREADPDMTSGDIKKLSQRTMSKYRDEVGAIRRRDRSITITDKEWEAIQAGAIHENKLKQILDNSDPDLLRERAMPKDRKVLSQAQINRIKAMAASDFTLEEIAKKMNISKTSVSKYLKGAN